MKIKREELIERCMKEKEGAYAPYSNFTVGAAVQTLEGEIFGGFNIENASYGATNCAERSAIFSALHSGSRKIVALAVTGDATTFTYPCGICRQVMAEFGEADLVIYVVKNKDEVRQYTLAQLLPGAFTPKDLLEDDHV